jgi:hypothetical protein
VSFTNQQTLKSFFEASINKQNGMYDQGVEDDARGDSEKATPFNRPFNTAKLEIQAYSNF